MKNIKIVFMMREYELVRTHGIYDNTPDRSFEICCNVYAYDGVIDLINEEDYGRCGFTTDAAVLYDNMSLRDTMNYRNFLNRAIYKYIIKACDAGKGLFLHKHWIGSSIAINALCVKQISCNPKKYGFSSSIFNQIIQIDEIEKSYKVRDLICDINGNIILKPNQYFVIDVKMKERK